MGAFGITDAEFEAWLVEVGLLENGKLTARAGDASFFG